MKLIQDQYKKKTKQKQDKQNKQTMKLIQDQYKKKTKQKETKTRQTEQANNETNTRPI